MCRRRVDRDRHIGVEILRRYFRAAQTDLFLHRERRTNIHICGRMLQQIYKRGNTDAVIDRFRHDRRTHASKLRGETCAITDLRLACQTQIDPQAIHRHFTRILTRLHQMDGFAADHTGRAILANIHLLTKQMPHIDPAYGFKAIDTLAFIRHDHKADFIHMRIEHDASTLLSTPLPGRQYVA